MAQADNLVIKLATRAPALVTASVRWVECVQALKARGITHLVECGPGKVLMGLTKRIDAELTGSALYDPATLNEVKELLA